MNYRHHYHAGNYADVFKHVLLLRLVAAMQRKEKGFLYLDTHAGRGDYDLEEVQRLPDGRERAAEWPAGIGRLLAEPEPAPVLADYLAAVAGFPGAGPRRYPGSPWIVQPRLRPQDRAVFCELRPEDAAALARGFDGVPRVSVRTMDGYTALRALLPPPEKRALVLIDPPFEQPGEFDGILAALREALRRFPSGTYAVWYPVTERARSDRFLAALPGLEPACPPALNAELRIAAESSQVRMKGCGLLVLNPPWRIAGEFEQLLPVLAARLGVDATAAGSLGWPVPER